MFARRNFNIDAITVGKTNIPDTSKIVVTAIGTDKKLEQLEKQINKLVEVVKVNEANSGIIREVGLIKIHAPDGKNSEKSKEVLFEYVKTFEAKFSELKKDSMIIEIVGNPEKIDSFIDLLRSYGIMDISRTGSTAMGRGK
jgi:acetolactate synthase I/III small subunit